MSIIIDHNCITDINWAVGHARHHCLEKSFCKAEQGHGIDGG